ncbi:MAG TPA: 8-amino-7-oxononanoate synthase [Steroidobacteraceae bacterium]|nr:8-amino-7-oxononanoate synthase [Steroidobacteraceae bacterium]
MRLTSLEAFARDRLAQQKAAGRERRRRVIERWIDASPVAVVEGRDRIVFCSNDYLGLARDPRLQSALTTAARSGAGSGASHLVCGHSEEHHLLEEELARFTQRPRALLFSSGYLANLGVVTALTARGDRVIEDKLNHASLIDAALLSRAELVRYAHGDASAAKERLSATQGQPPADDSTGCTLLVTDGVFSMDGDLAPLPELAAAAADAGAWLMVDDAHGLGVIGASGRGSLELAGLDVRAAPVLMGTLGKAFGTFGAFVAGSEELIELLIQNARSYIYTTALPPAVASATRASLSIVAGAHDDRARLRAHIELFRREVPRLGLQVLDSHTPIQPVVLGSNERAVAASEALWERGLWVSAIRPPTVPEGTARLRVTLCANHTHSQVLQLIEALSQVARQLS